MYQHLQLENGSCPLGRDGPGWAVPSHTSMSQLAPLSLLYKLNGGSYSTYVLMREPRMNKLVQSTTLSFNYSETHAADAK